MTNSAALLAAATPEEQKALQVFRSRLIDVHKETLCSPTKLKPLLNVIASGLDLAAHCGSM